MKNYSQFVVLSLFVITMLSVGCATKRPMVSAGRYSQLSVTPTNTIALTTKVKPGRADTELNRILVAELQREGFNVVSYEIADYILAYTFEDEWTENHQQSVTARQMPASQTTTQLMSGSQPTDTPSAIADTSFTSQTQGIRLVLYTNPKTHPGGLQIAWQGCIDPGKNISSQNEPALIRTLLGYFGRDYNGPVNLAK